MGYRATMFPDNHDENWSHKTNGIHRFPQEVRYFVYLASLITILYLNRITS